MKSAFGPNANFRYWRISVEFGRSERQHREADLTNDRVGWEADLWLAQRAAACNSAAVSSCGRSSMMSWPQAISRVDQPRALARS